MTQRNDATRNAIRTADARSLRDVAVNQGQVLLDTDHNEQGRLILDRVEEGTSEILGAPNRLVVQAGSEAFALFPAATPGDCMIGAGNGWLNGWRVENARKTKLSEQPCPLHAANYGTRGALGLKALVRYIDPVEDPALADKALGDAQAAGRTLIDWQVFPVPLSAADAASCVTAYASAAWTGLSAPSTGTLAFVPQTSAASIDPCSLTPEGGYARLENLLYRIEVHDGTAVGGAAPDGPRFRLGGLKLKLSRRNASVLARITAISAAEITVSPSARDTRTWFAPGQYAEIVTPCDDLDAARALAAKRLFRIARAEDDRVILEATGAEIAATGAAANGKWFLRLWDAFPDGSGVKEVALGGGGLSQPIDLGDGLAVQLGGGNTAVFRRGDHWCCAARADGSIDWPVSGSTFTQLPPQGPEIRYAIIGLYDASASPVVLRDCRVPFAPLTEHIQVVALGGDGQEVMPDTASPGLTQLPFKLRVGVVRGSSPVAGQSIRFTVLSGNGQLEGGVTTATVQTGPDGVAQLGWSLGAADPAQQVEAVRLDPAGQPSHAPIRFNGFLSRADQTSFDPANTPQLSGAHDVQTAIELLAGQQQTGCSTYVIQEGSDWVAILQAVKDGEDAAICFQRGIFKADKPVGLTNKGHLKICGAGPGTQIVVSGQETALAFEACASVELGHLHVSAPDSSEVIGKLEHRNGTVSIKDCQEATVRDCTIECGAGASAQRCCLRIAGQPGADFAACVTGNTFRAGYMQDGVIVSDCDQIVVRDNVLRTVPRPGAFKPDYLVADRLWLHAMTSSLFRNLRLADAPAAKAGAMLRGERYEVAVATGVPQAEWERLMAEDPPKAADERSSANFAGYVERILAKAVEQPGLMPSFESNLRTVRMALGDRATSGVTSEAVRKLLVSEVSAPAAVAASPRTGSYPVRVQAGNLAMTFDSPVSERDWRTALNASGLASRIKDQASFRRSLFAIGKRFVTDDSFTERLGTAMDWRRGYFSRLRSFSRDAISCVGKALGKVSISGNRITDFQLGVRVATSHGKWTRLYINANDSAPRHHALAAQSVDIHDNQVLLRSQAAGGLVPFGMFVGHAQSVRVTGNELHYADRRHETGDNYDLDYRHGLRLFGDYGRLVVIKDNHISVATPTIYLKQEETQSLPSTRYPFNWVIADNMGYPFNKEGTCVRIAVDEPSRVTRRNNVP